MSKSFPTDVYHKLEDAIIQIKSLKNLLNECIEHLEFCNYGDAWENECAEPLIKKVTTYQESDTWPDLDSVENNSQSIEDKSDE